MKEKEGAIILAAGRGKRMESKRTNKVTLPLDGKPMVKHTAELLQRLGVNPAVVVVGFAQKSVRSVFEGENVLFAVQRRRLGTAHAVSVALREIPADVANVIILQGDDSAFYKKETIQKLIEEHKFSHAALTFLTIDVDNPRGLGRIVRDKDGKLIGIVEEKDATNAQRRINEINPACYIARTAFLRKYLGKIKKSPVTGEYYLTSLIDIAIRNKEKVVTLRGGKLLWRGVNTPQELKEAEELISKLN